MALRQLARWVLRGTVVAAAAVTLAACQSDIPKHLQPLPAALVAKIEQLGMRQTAPIFVRIFKEESQLEVWKQQRDGRYALLETYEICKWSGELGPKIREGDRQAPEGFYTVTPAQMNPNSNYYLSFNLGYPNAYDKSLGRTGAHLMVHGACSSAGCYSMNDDQVAEIFALARDAFRGGQRSFQVQAFPFRMTAENMARHHDNPNMSFWKMLKVGYDHFEVTRQEPKVDVCDHRYVFNAEAGNGRFVADRACPAYQVPPSIQQAVAAKAAEDDRLYQVALARLEREAAPQATMIADARPAAMDAAAEPAANIAAFADERPRRGLFGRLFGREPEIDRSHTGVVVAGMPTPRPNPVAHRTTRAADAGHRAGAPALGFAPADDTSIRARIADAFDVLIEGAAPVRSGRLAAR